MRLSSFLLTLLALTSTLSAQRHKLTINAETPEGQQLQAIGQEADPTKKVSLMEEFLQKSPKHEGSAWVLEQLVINHLKANDFDKTLGAVEKLLAIDPDDVVTAHNGLKAAEGKKDPALVRQWALATSKAARKAVVAPKPSDEEEVDQWKATVDYARQVDTYTEYSLYATALAATDPNQKIVLYEALQAQNPQTQYLDKLTGVYFLALRQSNNNDKAVAFAEKTLEKDQSNEDMLLVVIDNYFNKKANPDQVISYGNKLAEMMSSKPKPEGISDSDWEQRKNLLTGLGYWYAGITYGNQSKYPDTDATLRKALPLVSDNAQLKAQALFYLGLANYKMGEPKKDKKYLAEALKFNQQCAAIKSGFQGQASKNATVIRQQLGGR